MIGLCAALFTMSCSVHEWFKPAMPDHYNKVILLYSAGFNNISSFLKDDIEEFKQGMLPRHNSENVVLVYSHFPTKGGYNTPSSPTLVRLSCKKDKTVIADTLKIFPEGVISASADQLENVLSYINEHFPAESYGMVFSSHATGYLPTGYYQNTENSSSIIEWSATVGRELTAVPYIEPEYDPSRPMVKSIGQDQVGTYGNYLSYEINLDDFASAIPMYLDYILFDACLMGGIEVAYELKDKVGKVGFSQAEVLAYGFCYETLTQHLIGSATPDLEGVCHDYFEQYETQKGVYQSATISLIDCSRLSPLAEGCKGLFKKYSERLDSLDHTQVQGFFRDNKHWFYDLESILINAGISEDELSDLHQRLDDCVLYKAHTPKFMDDFDIHTFCGFSMYLPCQGSESLNTFYKTLKWNRDTGLVN